MAANNKKVLHEQQNVVSGSVEEKEYLDRLSRQIMDVNVEFTDFISKADASHKYVAERADAINSDYNQRLMMMITMPLRRGCSRDAILQSVGVAAGALLFSKDFRKSCSATVQNMMYPFVQAKADKAGPNSFWSKQRDKLAMAEKGRLPLTPESAAVMHLGFCKGAYNKMREPGADKAKVLKDYKLAVKSLQTMAFDDGISGDVLNQSVRTIAGQLIERDPRLAVCFEELSIRGVSRGAGKVEDMVETWRGEYLDSTGNEFKGSFNPRVPRTKDEYGRLFSNFLNKQFENCKSTDELIEVMKQAEHKQVRDKYMECMMQDGMTPDQIRTNVTQYLNKGVNDWCVKNNIKTKGQSGPRPQSGHKGPSKKGTKRPVNPDPTPPDLVQPADDIDFEP